MDMPFPGMDPYLEHHVLWTSLHTRMIVALADQLAPRIEPRYVASVEERIYLQEPGPQRTPDVWVQKVTDAGSIASGALVTAPVVVEVEQQEVHEHYVEILDLYHDRRVVTVIEMVSPSNKASGEGRRSYRSKQRATLASRCHLVEIDLLRRGRHVLSVPARHREAAQPYEYLYCVNRWPNRQRFELYPCRLRERLLPLAVPLAQPDHDVTLDVQGVLEHAYRHGGYRLRVRYDAICHPVLAPEDQQWASERWAAYRAAHPEVFPPAES